MMGKYLKSEEEPHPVRRHGEFKISVGTENMESALRWAKITSTDLRRPVSIIRKSFAIGADVKIIVNGREVPEHYIWDGNGIFEIVAL